MTDKIISLPKRQPTLREALMASLQEDKDAQFDHFNDVYAKLLRAQADVAEAIAGKCSDRRLAKLQDIEGEAQWEVIHARAVQRWQIGRKLQLIEELLSLGGDWVDRREFFLLASARMDLKRPEPLAASKPFISESGGSPDAA